MTDKPEKKFVIRHVFRDVKDFMSRNDTPWPVGPCKKHFNINWYLMLGSDHSRNYHKCQLQVFLCCMKNEGPYFEWGVETSYQSFVNGKPIQSGTHHFCDKCTKEVVHTFAKTEMENYFVNGEMEVECHVTIDTMPGFKFDLRSFDDESAKKYSDVVLKIGDRKFHVMKMYLASQCSYFEVLFSGNFLESQKSEIELKDIDPQDFQNFLELLHGEAAVGRYTYKGILKLADFFDSKTAVRYCERWLINETRLSKEKKLEAAKKYNLEELK